MRLRTTSTKLVAAGLLLGLAGLVAWRPGATAGTIVAAATPSPSPSPTPGYPTPTPTNPCGPIWTDPSGDEVPANGSLDLLQGTWSVTSKALVMRTQVADLQSTLPTGVQGEEWQTAFTLNGIVYAALVQLDQTGSFTYTLNNEVTDLPESGSVTLGPGGTIEIDLSLADVGNPTDGEQILNSQGNAGTTAGGLFVPSDIAQTQYVYVFGQKCK